MPILENIQGHPHCIPNNYQNGNGVNMALWNEISDSIKFELNAGVTCISNFGEYMPLPVNSYSPIIVCGGSKQFTLMGTPTGFSILQSIECGFEIFPFYDQFKLLCSICLRGVSYMFANNLIKMMSARITINNITRNTSEVIGHFFADENAVNAWCAAGGLPQHGTPAQYAQTIGVNEIFLNYAVDIHATLQPLGDWSDVGRLKIEIMLPPMPAQTYMSVLNISYPAFYGIKSFTLKQVMQCQ